MGILDYLLDPSKEYEENQFSRYRKYEKAFFYKNILLEAVTKILGFVPVCSNLDYDDSERVRHIVQNYMVDSNEVEAIPLFSFLEQLEFSAGNINKRSSMIYHFKKLNVVVVLGDFDLGYMESPSFHYIAGKSEEDILLAYKKLRKFAKDSSVILEMYRNPDGREVTRKYIQKDKSIKWENVYLPEAILSSVKKDLDLFFRADTEYLISRGIKPKRGILLYGSPGNGKTTLIKSISHTVECPVLVSNFSSDTTSYDLRSIFDEVEYLSPCVLVMEDMDSLYSGIRSVFLNLLDGMTNLSQVLMIGTTNFPDKVDPALVNRPGRFDRTYHIQDPTEEMRAIYLRSRGIFEYVTEEDFPVLVKETEGFSVASLNEVYTSYVISHVNQETMSVKDIVDPIKESYKKQKSSNWEESKKEMGFKLRRGNDTADIVPDLS